MTDLAATISGKSISRDRLVAELRALKPLFADAGVTHMVLFGSRARGDNRPDSDVDLVIEVEPDRKFSLLDLIGVEHAIEDRLGLSANILMRRSLRPKFREELDRDGMDVF